MNGVATSPPEQGQLVSVRSRQWIVNGVGLNTLPPSILSPIFNPPDKLDAVVDSMRWGAIFTADVKRIRSSIHCGIDSEEGLSEFFASEELPPELRAVRVVANKAAKERRFITPLNILGSVWSGVRWW